MSLRTHLKAWSGSAFRHIPAGSKFDVLDFRFAGMGGEHRWNEAGERTLYLAGDEGVLIAEWGRHFAVGRTHALQEEAIERSVYRLEVTLDRVLDLRNPDVWNELSLSDAPQCFLEVPTARAVANFVRVTTDAQALLVPSAAFLDELERWCLVVFLEKVPEPAEFIARAQLIGPLKLG